MMIIQMMLITTPIVMAGAGEPASDPNSYWLLDKEYREASFNVPREHIREFYEHWLGRFREFEKSTDSPYYRDKARERIWVLLKALDRCAEALEIQESMLKNVEVGSWRWQHDLFQIGYTARCAAILTTGDERERFFERSIEAFQAIRKEVSNPYVQMAALAAEADTERVLGDDERAGDLLREAYGLIPQLTAEQRERLAEDPALRPQLLLRQMIECYAAAYEAEKALNAYVLTEAFPDMDDYRPLMLALLLESVRTQEACALVCPFVEEWVQQHRNELDNQRLMNFAVQLGNLFSSFPGIPDRTERALDWFEQYLALDNTAPITPEQVAHKRFIYEKMLLLYKRMKDDQGVSHMEERLRSLPTPPPKENKAERY